MAALRDIGSLSGQVRGQDYGIASTGARAQDAITAFNARNRQDVEQANVNIRNQAQAANLAEKQRIADENVRTSREEERRKKTLPQDIFGMELAKAGGQQAGQAARQEGAGNMIGGIGSLMGGIGGLVASDMSLKEDVQEFNPSEFLDELVPLKYNYKNPEDGQGPQAGISAQALEQVAPQAVSEREDGMRQIDPSKLTMPLLAALADLSGRVKHLEGGR